MGVGEWGRIVKTVVQRLGQNAHDDEAANAQNKRMPRKPRTSNISRSDYHDITYWLQHYACFHCRKAFKQSFDNQHTERLCPQCRQPMTNMGTDFKAPAQKEANQWRKIQLLAQAGVKFFPQWPDELPGERPGTLAEVPDFLRRIHPPSEGGQLLEQLSQEPKRPQAPREGKLSIQGIAPHQTFHLLGRKLVVGAEVQVLRDEGWIDAEAWGHPSSPEQPSHFRVFKLGADQLRYAGTLPLDGTLRLRWPAT